MRKVVLLLVSAALGVLLACGVVWADTTFQVTNTNDSGAGSLRQAIIKANAHSGADVITFAPDVSGEFDLRSVLPALGGEVEIQGPGAGKLAVRRVASERFRIFTVLNGV